MVVYTVLWTEDILAETIHHLRKEHPEWEGGRIADICEKIRDAFPQESHRVRDFNIVASKDECDGHVKGAALAGNADIILTNNIKDFRDDTDDLSYEVYTPDEFFLLVWKSAPPLVEAVARKMDEYYRSKGVPFAPTERLRAAGAQEFAKVVAGILRDVGPFRK